MTALLRTITAANIFPAIQFEYVVDDEKDEYDTALMVRR